MLRAVGFFKAPTAYAARKPRDTEALITCVASLTLIFWKLCGLCASLTALGQPYNQVFLNLMHRSCSHRQHPELVDSWSQKLLFVKVTSTLNCCYWTLFKRKEVSNESSIDKVKIEGHDLLCPSKLPAVLNLVNAPWHNFFGHTLRPFLYSYRPWVAHFPSRHLSLRWPFLTV